eukprot:4650093-Amphidinium_carterae.2
MAQLGDNHVQLVPREDRTPSGLRCRIPTSSTQGGVTHQTWLQEQCTASCPSQRHKTMLPLHWAPKAGLRTSI